MPGLAKSFEATIQAGVDTKLATNWHLGEFLAAVNKAEIDPVAAPVSGKRFASLLKRIEDGTISGKIAKDVFDAMWAGEGDADAIIEARGLRQISDEGAIERIVDGVIDANPAIVAEFRAGREKAFNSLVGKAMQASKGKANPAQVNAALKKKLSS
jgi:aspartyl-tRNA(Asn)/glutamyl-tRNA(Gln) amidotransferase subunit B